MKKINYDELPEADVILNYIKARKKKGDVVVKYSIHKVIVHCNKNKRLRAKVNGKNFEAKYRQCSKEQALKKIHTNITNYFGNDPNTRYEISI